MTEVEKDMEFKEGQSKHVFIGYLPTLDGGREGLQTFRTTLFTDDRSNESVELSVNCRLVQNVEISPTAIRIGAGGIGEADLETLNVHCYRDTHLPKVIGIQSDCEALRIAQAETTRYTLAEVRNSEVKDWAALRRFLEKRFSRMDAGISEENRNLIDIAYPILLDPSDNPLDREFFLFLVNRLFIFPEGGYRESIIEVSELDALETLIELSPEHAIENRLLLEADCANCFREFEEGFATRYRYGLSVLGTGFSQNRTLCTLRIETDSQTNPFFEVPVEILSASPEGRVFRFNPEQLFFGEIKQGGERKKRVVFTSDDENTLNNLWVYCEDNNILLKWLDSARKNERVLEVEIVKGFKGKIKSRIKVRSKEGGAYESIPTLAFSR